MMEDEQTEGKYWQRYTGKNVQKGIYIKKEKSYQYIVKATQMPNGNINEHQSILTRLCQCKDSSRRTSLLFIKVTIRIYKKINSFFGGYLCKKLQQQTIK